MLDRIIKRDGRVMPFDAYKITFAILRALVAVGQRDEGAAEALTRHVLEKLRSRYPDGTVPTVEEVQDQVEDSLIEQGFKKAAKAYILYRYEHALKRAGRESLTYSSENIPYRKLWHALAWAVDNRCVSLGQLREHAAGGTFPELIRASEAFYAAEIQDAREKIEPRMDELKMIIIAGPSSSGKTTTTIKLEESIAAHGRRLVPINVDHYFFDLESHPRDSHGDYDYETPQALDMELLGDHLRRIAEGQEVEIPLYNFKTGRREGVSGSIRLGERDILLVDSLHGLSREMTESIPPERIFKVYIETLGQIKDDHGEFVRWADIRMMRRMVRDMQFRNYNPRQTLLHWYLVRRSELRYIISRIRTADVIVNSFLPYELPIMKGRLAPMVPGFLSELEGQADRRDAVSRAMRMRELFAALPDWEDESAVPGNSLLREFIGGSTYAYH